MPHVLDNFDALLNLAPDTDVAIRTLDGRLEFGTLSRLRRSTDKLMLDMPAGGAGAVLRRTFHRAVILDQGQRYIWAMHYASGNGRMVRRNMVASYHSIDRSNPHEPSLILSLRPLAGTQTLPVRQVIAVGPTQRAVALPYKPSSTSTRVAGEGTR